MSAEPEFDVFISYRWVTPDQEWVRDSLAPALKAAGLRSFLDVEDFLPGRDVVLEMTRAGQSSRHALCIFSPEYVQPDRMAVFEALDARRRDPMGRHSGLIPFLLRKTKLPEWICSLVAVDWTRPEFHAREWRKLLRALGAPNPDAAAPPPVRPATLEVSATEPLRSSPTLVSEPHTRPDGLPRRYRRDDEFGDRYGAVLHHLRPWYEKAGRALQLGQERLQDMVVDSLKKSGLRGTVHATLVDTDELRLTFKETYDGIVATCHTEPAKRHLGDLLTHPVEQLCMRGRSPVIVRCVCPSPAAASRALELLCPHSKREVRGDRFDCAAPMDPIRGIEDALEAALDRYRLELRTPIGTYADELISSINSFHAETMRVAPSDPILVTAEFIDACQLQLKELEQTDSELAQKSFAETLACQVSATSLLHYARKALNRSLSPMKRLPRAAVFPSFSRLWLSHMLWGLARAGARTIDDVHGIALAGWDAMVDYADDLHSASAAFQRQATDYLSKALIFGSSAIAEDYPLIAETQRRCEERNRPCYP